MYWCLKPFIVFSNYIQRSKGLLFTVTIFFDSVWLERYRLLESMKNVCSGFMIKGTRFLFHVEILGHVDSLYFLKSGAIISREVILNAILILPT